MSFISSDHINNGNNLALIEPPGAQARTLNGLLVSYKDDQINECVNTALRRKSRVRYKCMDTFSNLLAFGTSGGAIYLFRLKTITHSSCSLNSVIPCDQGSIETIRFLPNPQADDLLIAIGTTRGSLVIFRLTQAPGEQSPHSSEVYRTENFTQNSSIKLIEYDQDLLDPLCSFTKVYICDAANRLYVLDTSNIYSAKQTLRLFYSNLNSPSLIFSVNDSNINQISVHKSQLLISTDETTRFFNEHSNQLSTIGKKKRRRGYYGACFFNPNYKPIRILQMQPSNNGQMGQGSRCSSQQTMYSSTASLNDLDNLSIFVARPSFRLWQVNSKREVMFTHQFEPAIKANEPMEAVELQNEPLEELSIESTDDHGSISRIFASFLGGDGHSTRKPKGDHFQKLLPLYSPTLGNLLLSHTEQEIFVIDPIGAKLIAWYQQDNMIVQVACIENEIFVWSMGSSGQQQQQFLIDRLVLLAPAQFILELHRIHRYLSLMCFVQLFVEQFRRIMTLPLTHSLEAVTVEGGLLRNILLSTWDSFKHMRELREESTQSETESVSTFRQMVDEIVRESRQLKQSMENLSDPRFLLTMTNENIERLCCEPYTSLVSLEVSIANLHTNHVIHFSKDALNRHKSMANLNASVQNLTRLKATKSTLCLDYEQQQGAQWLRENPQLNGVKDQVADGESCGQRRDTREVIVERQRPLRRGECVGKTTVMTLDEMSDIQKRDDATPFFSPKAREEARQNKLEDLQQEQSAALATCAPSGAKSESARLEADPNRCSHCLWPRPRSHLKPMHSSQRIQLNWLQENLMVDFENNLDVIQEHAFKHGLWQLFMRCLVHKNNLDDFITCCILLDDVRLLDCLECADLESNPALKDEYALMDKLLEHLGEKMQFLSAHQKEGSPKYCLKCRSELRAALDESEHLADAGGVEQTEEDAIAFNLVNLFEQLITRRCVDIKRAVSCLAKSSSVLNNCKISAKFYLKIIATATLAASQRKASSRAAASRMGRYRDSSRHKEREFSAKSTYPIT